ncbi:MAG: peptidyl-prolyl cis-trans isomerase [bacterium]|nr:peptidyl-prolyl cis-trans isomerase [bacterium]
MKLLREPLIHFLALGAGLFLLFAIVGDREDGESEPITVSAARVELLAQGFARTWQRPPTPQELEGLIEDYVREEIYYRQAVAMGLDRNDTIVRRRMRQKLEFFLGDMLDSAEPTEENLRAYLTEHPEPFQAATRITFEHVYFNSDERGEAATADARRLLERLEAGAERLDVATLGDRLPLPRKYTEVPLDKVGYRFGSVFVEQLADLPVGSWAGPIESGYGLHLVLIRELQPGEAPRFEDAREAVEREWRATRRKEAEEAFYQGLRERYEVVVEPQS